MARRDYFACPGQGFECVSMRHVVATARDRIVDERRDDPDAQDVALLRHLAIAYPTSVGQRN